MATITWKGAPEGDNEGPKSCTWGGVEFKKGEAVEVTNPDVIKRAKGSVFFEVSGEEPPVERPPEYRPPSEQSAQGPVPKGGEPVPPLPLIVPRV